MKNSVLPKAYEPAEVEDKWYRFWEEQNLFRADANSSDPSYSIVIPPPNVTGDLHMGHALNNTLQDILCRYRRMYGDNVLWMPGTDHAGIATQNVVERQLAEEGLDRHQLGREKFIERVWEWRQLYGGKIINPLKGVITWLYQRKEQSSSLEKKVYKRIMAGIWGRMLQVMQTGELGDYFNPVWGVEVESRTRLEVARFVLDNNLQDNLLSIAVDGVLVSKC